MKYGIYTITLLLFLVGCDQPQPQSPVETKENDHTSQPKTVEQTYIPPPPRKKVALKDINDTNFDTDYMYPEDTKKETAKESPLPTPAAAKVTMDKEECIAMISLEKFEKYAAIFGSEAASIKRCEMLRATR
ncbi:MAG TPA: hypothetical protein VIM88_07410 [Sulfurovum sp.]|uniref:hypothetical protein n=1 Tax=Sulfurovum sp. TaxID=1969726 RepID=UPI002F959D1A